MGAAVSQELIDRTQGRGLNQAIHDPDVHSPKLITAEANSWTQIKAFIENVAWP